MKERQFDTAVRTAKYLFVDLKSRFKALTLLCLMAVFKIFPSLIDSSISIKSGLNKFHHNGGTHKDDPNASDFKAYSSRYGKYLNV